MRFPTLIRDMKSQVCKKWLLEWLRTKPSNTGQQKLSLKTILSSRNFYNLIQLRNISCKYFWQDGRQTFLSKQDTDTFPGCTSTFSSVISRPFNAASAISGSTNHLKIAKIHNIITYILNFTATVKYTHTPNVSCSYS